MRVERQKLSKGMSYPLKSSILSRTLIDAGIDFDTQLILGVGAIFFAAHFWPPNPNVPRERLYIRASAVPTQQGPAAREFMETTVIPQFVAWAKNIAQLPINSPIRREKQTIQFDLKLGTERPG